MKVMELHEAIKEIIEKGHGEETVVITLKQPSVGSRASVGIRHAMLGFDWEAGQFRLEPQRGLTAYDKDRDNPIPVKTSYPDGRKAILIKCPKCGEHLTKAMKYCHRCGQRVLNVNES